MLRNRMLLTLSLAVFVAYAGTAMIVPVRVLYAQDHGASLAIIGAMAGYMLGQSMARIIVLLDVFHGLNLNFSSLSAVFSTALVMAVVLLSTLYPAKKAGRWPRPPLNGPGARRSR